MKKTIIIIFSILICAMLCRFAYSLFTGYLTGKKMSRKVVPVVKVQEVKNQNILRHFEASGRIVSKYQVGIIARVSGYLQKSYFKEGSYVKAGDTLFLIEPAEYKNAANVSSADIKDIKAKLNYANKQLERAKELVKEDYIAKSKYDEILSERDSLVAQLSAAKSEHSDKERNLSYTKIKAPVDGRIGTIDVTVGNYVNASTGSLTTINSTNPIYVTFPLSTDDYNAMTSIDKPNEKHRVELYFSNGKKYKFDGIQDFLDNKIDETTGTVMYRATFQNPDNELLHGEFVKVKIFSNHSVNIPMIPVKAIMSNQEGKYVYVLNKNNLPKIRYIKTGEQYGNNQVVQSGLKQGDKIITDGVIKVTPNKPVKIKDIKAQGL
ncbi:MAG: efflux RND transporter periplasmic adaptor subunit [Cyanobacteriota bacterium]|nr:efflux RND transporter periplasmic adaptor subunit [Cyanobacteriota bacterium]MDY6358423.1 efflux RND transporter periplasmic adaptor subunit [Cyanobacteriota bacterium]